MKKYTKLFRIKYNNKLFDIYSDENHRKTFLEIKIENGIEKTYYPELKDYIHLELVYNKKSDILYSRKYTFKEKVALFSTIGIAISSFQFAKQIAYNYNLQREAQNYKVVMERCVDNDNPIIKEYMSSEITFDDVRNTLQQNVNIQDEYRKYINLLIDRLEERLPHIDLRRFNYNLKSLSFNVIPNEKWNSENAAYYTLDTNTITLKSETYIEILFHELCHLLRNIMIKDGNNILFFDAFYVGIYGNSFSEGFNTILADYLLVDDWQNYFGVDTRIYNQYSEITATQYQILKLLRGEYDFYNYLNSNIYDLEPKLEKLGLADIIDIMDVYANTLGDTTIVDSQEYDNLKQRILELRIKDELDMGRTDIELYKFLYQVQLEEVAIQVASGHIKYDDIYDIQTKIKELFEKNVHICTKVLSDENSTTEYSDSEKRIYKS